MTLLSSSSYSKIQIFKQVYRTSEFAVLPYFFKKCLVSTLSPLAIAFNAKPNRTPRLKFVSSSGLFGINELKYPDGFRILKERAINDSENLVKQCCSENRSKKLVELFDELSDTLCRVADLAEFIRLAHPEDLFSQAAEDASLAIGGLVEKLNTHKELYDSLKDVATNGDKFPTNSIDDHVANLFLFDFEQSGIHLDTKIREKVVQLNQFILSLGQHFMNSYMNPAALPVNDVTETFRQYFCVQDGKVIVTGLHADSSDEIVRMAAYKLYYYSNPEQEYILSSLLRARYEMSSLCGFKSYAHRAIRGCLAETPELVQSFLLKLKENLKQRADEDFKEMFSLKKAQYSFSQSLSMWDIPYYTSLVRQSKCSYSVSEIMPYFSLGTVMDGLASLFKHLFNITLEVEETVPGELWSSDVYKIAVSDAQKGLLGYIYCDFYERQGKLQQDCHFTIKGGRRCADGTYQNPIVVLHLNLPHPTWSTPSLLTPNMVENVFHEMGHAVHSMLARTKYQHVTGTRCSTDFAEVPSILMEYFASDPQVILSFARHYKTGEVIPKNLLDQMIASKAVFAASDMQLQCFYSAVDQKFHQSNCSYPFTMNTLKEVQEEFYGIPYVENTAWHLRFSHLIGYGAKYYSYLMSRAVASWIWQKYFIHDPFSRSMGEKLRYEVLCHGGGKPPNEMVAEFLEKEVSPDSLVEALINDLDHKKSLLRN